jgi:general L-amino acid transport system permease protein
MYLKKERSPDLPPPPSEVGVIGWTRHNLFSSWLNAVMTLIGITLIYFILPPILQWAVLKADWLGSSRDACTSEGACWVFIKVRFGMLMYGFYPEAERWRINFVSLLFAASAGPLLASPLLSLSERGKSILSGIVAAVCIGLSLALFGVGSGLIAAAYLGAPLLCSRIARSERVPWGSSSFRRFAVLVAATAGAYAGAAQAARHFSWGLDGALGYGTAVLTLLFLVLRSASARTWQFVLLFTVYPCIAYVYFLGGGFGLSTIETDLWGGMFLTLLLAGIGITASFPIGILLALGRRGKMPAVRAACIGFIELIRGVPLISVLFMASVMLPLTLPEGTQINKLLRAIVGVSLFYAAYIAEVVRGGLQAIPKGQYEAAESLGLRYWSSLHLIILPQALRLVIPGITNTFLGLAKDTTLVAVINLMDILGILKSALADANWLGFTKEAYLFAGLAFWVLCFGISRYSIRLEKRLRYQ